MIIRLLVIFVKSAFDDLQFESVSAIILTNKGKAVDRMEENTQLPRRLPRRRTKSKLQIFKEAYLPYLILLAATVLILIFIIGALVRG